jgi:hypothetical protein
VISAINARIGNNNSQGAAYVFNQADDGTWSETQKISASDGNPVDWFGSAVALSGDTVVVGAYGAHYNDQAMRGETYVFTNAAGVWTETQRLATSDGQSGDAFGGAVAISGTRLLISASGARIDDRYAQGAVYLFTQAGGNWTETQKIVASDGIESDQLGTSLAIDGDTALIGAVWYHGGQGAVYVFNDSGSTWTQTQRLGASDGAGIAGIGLPETDYFGISVALQGTTALVGATNVTINGNPGQGAAYQFTRAAGTFTSSHTFTASDGVANDYFGISVAMDGDNVAAGAFGYSPDFDHYHQGAAYFYRHVADVIPASERAVLVDIYNSTNGAEWWDITGWMGPPGTECSWTGVTCDDSGAHVIGLFFDFANMTGTLPNTLNGLTHLTTLQINDESGLSGSIPPLTGLTELQSIDLSRNAFTGSIPSLTGLASLQFAIFNANQLSGPLPSFEGLANLQWFAASSNQLSGSIPSLAGLGALTGFYVDYNQLTGAPPALPSPTSLAQYGASLCPNALDPVESTEWDTITGMTPWYHDCFAAPNETIFVDGFDAP